MFVFESWFSVFYLCLCLSHGLVSFTCVWVWVMVLCLLPMFEFESWFSVFYLCLSLSHGLVPFTCVCVSVMVLCFLPVFEFESWFGVFYLCLSHGFNWFVKTMAYVTFFAVGQKMTSWSCDPNNCPAMKSINSATWKHNIRQRKFNIR